MVNRWTVLKDLREAIILSTLRCIRLCLPSFNEYYLDYFVEAAS